MFGILVLIVAVVLSTVFFEAKEAKAASSTSIVINEVFYDTPGADSSEEWLELYNPSSEAIEIGGYLLQSNNDSKFVLSSSTVLNAGQYITIARNSEGFKALYGFEPDVDGLSLNLSNSGDFVSIENDFGVELDRVVWKKDKFCETISDCYAHLGVVTGHSLERKDSKIDTNDCSEDFVDQPSPTPKSGYIEVKYSDKIIVNEIVPKPENGAKNEFIELKNIGDEKVELTGWKIDDAEGGSLPYLIGNKTYILSGGYYVVYKSESKISLNDSGDIVRLISPDGIVRDMVSYDKANADESYAKFDGGWKWSMTLTPGKVNIFTAKEEKLALLELPLQLISICDARKIANKEEVRIEGVVTVVPGVLSKNQFYVQKNGCGIQIYSYYKRFPDLAPGDVVEVTGELSEYYNEKRLKTKNSSDIMIISHQNPILPSKVSINECNEETEGEVVEVLGVVTKTSGKTFWINGGQEIKVYIRKQTGIKKPKMRVGDKVKIVGVVSQYKEDYRILPYEQTGVIVLSSAILPRAGGGIWIYFTISAKLFITIVLWKLYLKMKRRLLHSQKRLQAN